MTHIVGIRDGMTESNEKDLSNIAVAFLNDAGGVVGASDYQITQQVSPNNTVLITSGRAYVPTTDGLMQYATFLDSNASVTIGSNTSGNPRVDAIVLYIDLSASPDSGATNVAKFYDVQGTPAGSPTAPNNATILAAIGASNPYLVLANITIANGFTSINNGNITDTRIYAVFTTGQTVSVPQYEEFLDQGSAPGTPATGYTRFYTKNGSLFMKLPSGTISQMSDDSLVELGSISGSNSINWSSGINQALTVGGILTLTFINPIIGKHYLLKVTNGDAYTTNWPASVKWDSGVAPTLGTGLLKIDLVGFFYDGTYYYGVAQTGY